MERSRTKRAWFKVGTLLLVRGEERLRTNIIVYCQSVEMSRVERSRVERSSSRKLQ